MLYLQYSEAELRKLAAEHADVFARLKVLESQAKEIEVTFAAAKRFVREAQAAYDRAAADSSKRHRDEEQAKTKFEEADKDAHKFHLFKGKAEKQASQAQHAYEEAHQEASHADHQLEACAEDLKAAKEELAKLTAKQDELFKSRAAESKYMELIFGSRPFILDDLEARLAREEAVKSSEAKTLRLRALECIRALKHLGNASECIDEAINYVQRAQTVNTVEEVVAAEYDNPEQARAVAAQTHHTAVACTNMEAIVAGEYATPEDALKAAGAQPEGVDNSFSVLDLNMALREYEIARENLQDMLVSSSDIYDAALNSLIMSQGYGLLRVDSCADVTQHGNGRLKQLHASALQSRETILRTKAQLEALTRDLEPVATQEERKAGSAEEELQSIRKQLLDVRRELLSRVLAKEEVTGPGRR